MLACTHIRFEYKLRHRASVKQNAKELNDLNLDNNIHLLFTLQFIHKLLLIIIFHDARMMNLFMN